MLRVNVSKRKRRVLCFDLETLAAGYADPSWVPDKITVAAWSWIGETRVESLITGKDGFFSARLRGERLEPLYAAIRAADVVVGHNIVRFDLPVLQAEALRCGLPTLGPVKTHDTIRIVRTKGFKKGQDDMSVTFGSPLKKKTLNWAEWDQAYEADGWPVPVERCVTDVQQNKTLYRKQLERGDVLKSERWWRP